MVNHLPFFFTIRWSSSELFKSINNTNFILSLALNCLEYFGLRQGKKLGHSHSYGDIFQRSVSVKERENKAKYNVILV